MYKAVKLNLFLCIVLWVGDRKVLARTWCGMLYKASVIYRTFSDLIC